MYHFTREGRKPKDSRLEFRDKVDNLQELKGRNMELFHYALDTRADYREALARVNDLYVNEYVLNKNLEDLKKAYPNDEEIQNTPAIDFVDSYIGDIERLNK